MPEATYITCLRSLIGLHYLKALYPRMNGVITSTQLLCRFRIAATY